MQLCKVRQRLGAVPPDPRVLDLQPVETPFKKSWIRPCVNIVLCIEFGMKMYKHKFRYIKMKMVINAPPQQ